jgi:putative cell wall-binding protein
MRLPVVLAAIALAVFGPPAASGAVAADADLLVTPVVTRLAGADRYDMAALVALRARPAGAEVVYIASGENYPDALSAGPAAVHRHGVLLLVQRAVVPAAAAIALGAMNPASVVIVGGTASVSDAVEARLQALAPRATVERIDGADRYEVSRTIAARAFTAGATGAFIATGRAFPDALSAGPAAAVLDQPVLLVDGGPPADIPTVRLLDSLRAADVNLMGGTSSLSSTLESSLRLVRSVTRIDGADRYAVSQRINEVLLQDYDTVYLVTGANFPDALAGGVLAGTTRSPMYVVPADCVPPQVITRMTAMGTRQVVLLGGTASLSPAVETLTPCLP